MKRLVLLGLGTVLLISIITFFDLIKYGLNQGKGQFEVLWNAQPIEEVLQNAAFPDSLKKKIKLIQEVRKYAVESIGLENSDNYTTLYNQGDKTLLWNLSASKPYQFEPKTWSFPFLGSFPYKGYFDLEKAMEEFQKLESERYDVRLRPVGGWSTLGWFSDPILSKMLDRSEGGLAELIIHELTHSTLFVKDNIEFNENLASFIGERGAVLFLKDKFGTNSIELTNYLNSEKDSKVFTHQMLKAASKLDSLYSSFSEEVSDSIKLLAKHLLIDEITSSLDTINFYDKRYYDVFKNKRPNNAYFMSYLRYHSSEDSLSNIFINEFNSDLNQFIQAMKAYHGE